MLANCEIESCHAKHRHLHNCEDLNSENDSDGSMLPQKPSRITPERGKVTVYEGHRSMFAIRFCKLLQLLDSSAQHSTCWALLSVVCLCNSLTSCCLLSNLSNIRMAAKTPATCCGKSFMVTADSHNRAERSLRLPLLGIPRCNDNLAAADKKQLGDFITKACKTGMLVRPESLCNEGTGSADHHYHDNR